MDRMSIGDFARATNLTPKALRLYDEMGLVRPAEVDEYSGYRYYRADQLGHARLVARLRLIGMPLDRIRALADLAPGARAAELLSYWRQSEADTRSRRSMVAALVEEIRSEEDDMWIDDTPHRRVAARSGVGTRDIQLDALMTGRRVYAVADGFGRAPDLAARALRELAGLDGATGPVDPVRLVDEAVTAAAGAVAGGSSSVDPDVESGCTLTALVLAGAEAVIAHVGDSRVYLVRDGRLTRLTRDHTHVQALVDEGRLTEEEARSDPDRMVLNRALVPGGPAKPDISLHATRPGDRFVLTTDGVHALLQPAALAALLTAAGSPEEVVDRVEERVLAAGAPDNYAIVAVDVPGDDS